MSWLVTAIVVTGTLQATSQYRAGREREVELKKKANEAELQASFEELDRRKKINAELAMNVVGQATSGITGEGTPSSIALENAKNIGISEGAETLSDRLKVAQLRRQGDMAKRAGTVQAVSTLLQTAVSAYGANQSTMTPAEKDAYLAKKHGILS